MASMDRILLISADCHAGPLPDTYRQYLEKSVHEEYAAWVAEAERFLTAHLNAGLV